MTVPILTLIQMLEYDSSPRNQHTVNQREDIVISCDEGTCEGEQWC